MSFVESDWAPRRSKTKCSTKSSSGSLKPKVSAAVDGHSVNLSLAKKDGLVRDPVPKNKKKCSKLVGWLSLSLNYWLVIILASENQHFVTGGELSGNSVLALLLLSLPLRPQDVRKLNADSVAQPGWYANRITLYLSISPPMKTYIHAYITYHIWCIIYI